MAPARDPEARFDWRTSAAREEFQLVQEVIKSMRTIRAEMKLDPKKRIAAQFSSENAKVRETIAANLDGILRLGLLTELTITDDNLPQSRAALRSTSIFYFLTPHLE